MKKLSLLFIAIAIISTALKANNINTKQSTVFATEQATLSQLLTIYYSIKDALVAGKADVAATQAGAFVKAIKVVDVKALTEPDAKAFAAINDKLTFDAEHISESKDIAHQRDHFKTFSDNLLTLAKAVKLSANPVYQQYCPMKKAAWLSSEAAIKNPYYGSAMLTCGSVKATL